MQIRLIFHGSLKKYNNNIPEIEIDIPDGTMIGHLIGQKAVPKEEIAFVAVNGSRAPLSQTLQNGDEMKIFQVVGGG